MKIADFFFGARLDDGPLQIDAKRSGDKAGETLGKSMTAKIKQSFSGGELGKGFVQGLGLAGALGGAQLLTKGLDVMTDFIGESIDAASDLNESMSKSGVIFGDASKDVEAFASTADKALGLSKQAALEAAASFGNLFLGTGQSEQKAAELSKSMVTLAGDLASFNNLDPTDALEKLRSGLTGEAEPLRAVGVFLTEAKVKAKAMELGLADTHGELSEGAKVMARYQVILDETKTAQGDFARTADGVANSQRTLNAEMENAKAALGQELLPLEQKWIQTQRDAIPVIITGVDAIGNMADGIGFLGDQMRNWSGWNLATTGSFNGLADGGNKVSHTFQGLSGDADAATGSLDSMATHSARGADAMVKSAGRVKTAYRDLRTDLLTDATGIVTNYYDVLITRDELWATNAEINALRKIESGRKLTHEEQANLHRLEQTQAQLESDLASHGDTQSHEFTATMADLLGRLKNAHGKEKAMIEAEIRKLQLLAIAAKIANGKVLTLGETITATLAKGGYITAAGAGTGGTKPKPVGEGHNATGGPMAAGEVSWVGEEGPELWVPDVAGHIIPNDRSVAMTTPGGSGQTINQTIYGMPMQPVTPRTIALEARRISRLHRLPGSPAEGFG